MAIIGVSDEALGTVRPFVESNGIKYLVAIEKAGGYKASSIPHAWLVSPKGEVVWEGNPASLNEAQIEENLKGASMPPPQLTLPKELKSVERDLSAADYSKGIKALETHLKKPKSSETETAAKNALEQINAYGASKLKTVDDLAKEKDYGSAAEILRGLDKSFKGHEVGDKAKTLLAEWKKDDKIKLELDAASVIEQAEAQIQAKQHKAAAGILMKVTAGKKYEGTRAREIAEKLLASVKRKL